MLKQITITDTDEFLAENLEENFDIKDFQIDRWRREAKVFFSQPDWKNKLEWVKKSMKKITIAAEIFMFALLFIGGFLIFKIDYYLDFFIMSGLLIVYWYYMVSPINHHTFDTDKQFITYRGYLEQGVNLKVHLSDYKYKFLVALYIMWDLMVFAAIRNQEMFIEPLNNMIYDRRAHPYSLVNSLIPAAVMIGLVVNIFGAFLYGRYHVKKATTHKKLEDPMFSKMLFGLVFLSILMLFFIAASIGEVFGQFWSPQYTSIFDTDDPMFYARQTIIIYYLETFFLGTILLVIIYLSMVSIEAGLIHIILRHSRETMEPPENNWEFSGTISRREKARSDLVKTRKRSMIEIALIILSMILGMWLFLFWGGELMGLKWMEYIGYGILGIGILWIFFFSQLFHAKHDGTYFYPTPKENVHYVAWDERGMGSWRHYWREDWPNKKRLIHWATFWFLFSMSFVFVEWEDLWDGKENYGGYLIDFVDDMDFLNRNYVVISIIILSTFMFILGFINSIKLTDKNFGDSMFWNYLYKILMALMVIWHIDWIANTLNALDFSPDLTSREYLINQGFIILVYIITALMGMFLCFPFILKVDNLKVLRKPILIIIINTVVLTCLIVWIFHFYMPQTGPEGYIDWPYPFEDNFNSDGILNVKEGNHETKYLWESFYIGDLIDGWWGRYIWWGGLQQYLFMSYFLVLWKKVFPNSKGYAVAVLTSMIFGFIHAIDWPLMIFTGLAGLLWAYYWNKEYYDPKTGKVVHGNNLLLWGFVHGFGGTLIGLLLPFSMGVGPFNM